VKYSIMKFLIASQQLTEFYFEHCQTLRDHLAEFLTESELKKLDNESPISVKNRKKLEPILEGYDNFFSSIEKSIKQFDDMSLEIQAILEFEFEILDINSKKVLVKKCDDIITQLNNYFEVVPCDIAVLRYDDETPLLPQFADKMTLIIQYYTDNIEYYIGEILNSLDQIKIKDSDLNFDSSPFTKKEHFNIVIKVKEWSYNKILKWSYLYEYLKSEMDLELNELEFFKYINDNIQRNCGRRNHGVNNRRYSEFLKVIGDMQ